MRASLLILLVLAIALFYRRSSKSNAANDAEASRPAADAGANTVTQSAQPDADSDVVPLSNTRTPHPMYRAITLSERVDTVQQLAERLPQTDATLSERRIIAEQIRMARFESDLIKTVICGHHPDASAIDIEWCYTSAELSLGFARARIERLSAGV